MFRFDQTYSPQATPNASAPGDVPDAFSPSPRRFTLVERLIKRMVDVVGAAVLLLAFAPLYVVVAVCVAISAGAPVHFSQTRLGRGGEPFRFLKFRSMVHDAEAVLDQFLAGNPAGRAEWDLYQALKRDPRITRVGRFIRRTSLDELPQFWNVLKGDMSLVGPRPCMVRQQSLHGAAFAHYCAVRPGITGLWQVSGRNAVSYARRVEMDVEYVRTWSLWLDLKILFRTARAVIAGD